MSLVTRLAWVSGQILLSVHLGSFSPVELGDEIQESKIKLNADAKLSCIAYIYHYDSFVDSCNCTNKADLHTCKVEIQGKYCAILVAML